MSSSAETWLAIIAVAVLLMALVQVGAIVAALRVARRVDQLANDMETSVKPLLANLTAMSAEASRAASLAAAQIERLDRMFGELATRMDRTLTTAQALIARPAKDGMAIVAGIKAGVLAFKGFRELSRRRHAARAVVLEDDEESLFIG